MAKKSATKNQPAGVADYTTVLRPLITEKSSLVGGDGSRIVFQVAPKASKDDIRGAVERIFQVEVDSVRTLTTIGKLRRRGKQVGRTPSYKKAYVTLKAGQTIDIVEGL